MAGGEGDGHIMWEGVVVSQDMSCIVACKTITCFMVKLVLARGEVLPHAG